MQSEEIARKKRTNPKATEKKNLRDCIKCDYSNRCTDDAKRHHGHYSPNCAIGDKVYQLRICSKTLSYAFRNAFPYLSN